MTQKIIAVNLSHEAIFRLAGLCDARVHSLRKFIAEMNGKPEEEADVSEAEEDVTYLEGLAQMLRSARDGKPI
jgi:hypothetical protein